MSLTVELNTAPLQRLYAERLLRGPSQPHVPDGKKNHHQRQNHRTAICPVSFKTLIEIFENKRLPGEVSETVPRKNRDENPRWVMFWVLLQSNLRRRHEAEALPAHQVRLLWRLLLFAPALLQACKQSPQVLFDLTMRVPCLHWSTFEIF